MVISNRRKPAYQKASDFAALKKWFNPNSQKMEREFDPHACDALAEVEALAVDFAASGFERPGIYNLPPAILVQGGPGIIAASFLR